MLDRDAGPPYEVEDYIKAIYRLEERGVEVALKIGSSIRCVKIDIDNVRRLTDAYGNRRLREPTSR
jgi:hypothetical protein